MSLKELLEENDIQNSLNLDIIKEYYDTLEIKKQSEQKLKQLKPIITSALDSLGIVKTNVGNYVVEKQVRNTSKINKEKLVDILLIRSKENPVYQKALKYTIDEDGLNQLIEEGLLSLEEIKEKCYEESKTEALIVRKIE